MTGAFSIEQQYVVLNANLWLLEREERRLRDDICSETRKWERSKSNLSRVIKKLEHNKGRLDGALTKIHRTEKSFREHLDFLCKDIRWQYKDESHMWRDFPTAINKKLEACFAVTNQSLPSTLPAGAVAALRPQDKELQWEGYTINVEVMTIASKDKPELPKRPVSRKIERQKNGSPIWENRRKQRHRVVRSLNKVLLQKNSQSLKRDTTREIMNTIHKLLRNERVDKSAISQDQVVHSQELRRHLRNSERLRHLREKLMDLLQRREEGKQALKCVALRVGGATPRSWHPMTSHSNPTSPVYVSNIGNSNYTLSPHRTPVAGQPPSRNGPYTTAPSTPDRRRNIHNGPLRPLTAPLTAEQLNIRVKEYLPETTIKHTHLISILEQFATEIRGSGLVRTRKRMGRQYSLCLVATELLSWITSAHVVSVREHAIVLCRLMMRYKMLYRVENKYQKEFSDSFDLYRFLCDDLVIKRHTRMGWLTKRGRWRKRPRFYKWDAELRHLLEFKNSQDAEPYRSYPITEDTKVEHGLDSPAFDIIIERPFFVLRLEASSAREKETWLRVLRHTAAQSLAVKTHAADPQYNQFCRLMAKGRMEWNRGFALITKSETALLPGLDTMCNRDPVPAREEFLHFFHEILNNRENPLGKLFGSFDRLFLDPFFEVTVSSLERDCIEHILALCVDDIRRLVQHAHRTILTLIDHEQRHLVREPILQAIRTRVFSRPLYNTLFHIYKTLYRELDTSLRRKIRHQYARSRARDFKIAKELCIDSESEYDSSDGDRDSPAKQPRRMATTPGFSPLNGRASGDLDPVNATPRPPPFRLSKTEQRSPDGNWICDTCHEENGNNRYRCTSCGAARPPQIWTRSPSTEMGDSVNAPSTMGDSSVSPTDGTRTPQRASLHRSSSQEPLARKQAAQVANTQRNGLKSPRPTPPRPKPRGQRERIMTFTPPPRPWGSTSLFLSMYSSTSLLTSSGTLGMGSQAPDMEFGSICKPGRPGSRPGSPADLARDRIWGSMQSRASNLYAESVSRGDGSYNGSPKIPSGPLSHLQRDCPLYQTGSAHRRPKPGQRRRAASDPLRRTTRSSSATNSRDKASNGGDLDRRKIYPYQRAIDRLGDLPKCRTPHEKMEILVQLKDIICQCVDEYNERKYVSESTPEPMTPSLPATPALDTPPKDTPTPGGTARWPSRAGFGDPNASGRGYSVASVASVHSCSGSPRDFATTSSVSRVRGPLIAADEMISLFALFVARSRLSHIHAQIAFMDDFMDEEEAQMSWGFYLITLQAACKALLDGSLLLD